MADMEALRQASTRDLLGELLSRQVISARAVNQDEYAYIRCLPTSGGDGSSLWFDYWEGPCVVFCVYSDVPKVTPNAVTQGET